MPVEIKRAAPRDREVAYAIMAEYYEAVGVPLRDGPRTILGRQPGSGWRSLVATSEIKRMYVPPARRGQGISQRLLETAERFVKESGYQWIYLDSTR